MDLLIYIWYCCCSVAKSFLTPCDPMDCSTPGFPVLHYLLHFAQTHVHWAVMSSNHLIFCRPVLLLTSILTSIRVFSNKSALSFTSVAQLGRLFVTPWTAAHQASLSITNPGMYSNSSPLSRWCHANISSSIVPFSSCPQSFPASVSFQMSHIFA